MSSDACTHCGAGLPHVEKWCPVCRLSRDAPIRHYIISVAGVTHANADGSSRQSILASMQPRLEMRHVAPHQHEHLTLHPEPDNPYDSNAVQIVRACTTHGRQQIGYVPALDALDIAPAIRAGCRMAARLLSIVGGDSERPSLGARVLIGHAGPRFDQNDLLVYMDRILGRFAEMG